jgi:hypothetical protein
MMGFLQRDKNRCKQCGERFSKHEELVQHAKKFTANLLLDAANVETNSYMRKTGCIMCNRKKKRR